MKRHSKTKARRANVGRRQHRRAFGVPSPQVSLAISCIATAAEPPAQISRGVHYRTLAPLQGHNTAAGLH